MSDRLALLRSRGIVRPPIQALSQDRLLVSLSSPLPGTARLLEALKDERDDDR